MARYSLEDKYKEGGKASEGTVNRYSLEEKFEQTKRYENTDTSIVNDEYINTFISDANSFFKGAEDTYKSIGWGNASSVYDSTNSSWQELQKRKDVLDAWLYKNKSRLTEDSYKSLSDALSGIGNGAASLLEGVEGAKDFYGQFETEDSYNKWKANEDWKKSFIEQSDFEEYSQKGEQLGLETHKAFIGTDGAIQKFGSDVNNYIIAFRNNRDANGMPLAASWNATTRGNTADPDVQAAWHMTDDEYQIYCYYYGKYGEESASEYLESIKDTLTQREAGRLVDTVDDSAVLKGVFSIAVGLDQWASGVRNLDNLIMGTDPDPISPVQIAGASVRESIESGFWRGAWDLGVTVSNQIPSILVGAGTGQVGGLITMGAGVAGNSYAEGRRDGLTANQARVYSGLVTAAELGLQSLIGGYTKLGGKLSNGLTEYFASQVGNGVAKFAIRTGGSMLSEGIEEALQSVLEPAFKSAVTMGEKAFEVDWSEVLYSGLLGALSAGFLEGIPSAIGFGVDAQNTYEAGKEFKKYGDFESLNKFSADTVAHKLAGKVDNKTSAYKVGLLLKDLDATITEKNASDIVQYLTDKGVTKKHAETYANAVAAVVAGYKLTDEQIKVLNANEHLSRAIKDVIIDPNSTINQRMQGYAEATKYIKKDYAANVKSAKNGSVAEQTGITSTEDETANASKFSHSTDGKTFLISTGEEVSVGDISSIKNGEVSVRLEDGREVNAKDVSFADVDDALMVEMVADLGVGTETANAMINAYEQGKGTVSAQAYRVDAPLAYRYGTIEYTKGLAKLGLTEDQKIALFARGRADAKASRDTSTESVGKKVEGAKNAQSSNAKSQSEGKIYREDGTPTTVKELKKSAVYERQKAGIEVVEFLSTVLGGKYYVFESYVNKRGQRVYKDANGNEVLAPNGYHRGADGSIHIDLNAGDFGEGIILNTLAHEQGHHIREVNKEGFKLLADFIVKYLEKKGVDVDRLVRERMDFMRKKGRLNGKTKVEAYDMAYEDVICDGLETIYHDGKVLDMINSLKTTEKGKSVIRQLLDKLKALITKIVNAYKNMNVGGRTEIGQRVAEMSVKEMQELQQLFAQALVDTEAIYSTISAEESQMLTDAGIGIDEDTQTAYSLRYTTLDGATVKVGKKEFDTEAIAQLVAKGTGRSIEDARKWVNSELAIANIVMTNPEFLDFEADNRYEAIKKNSDYPQGTVDMSNLCPKRTEFTTMFDMLQRKYPNKLFTASDVAEMRAILSKHNITVACGACFVEDRRQLLGEIADTYIGMWKEAVETGKGLRKVNAKGEKVELFVTADLAKKYGLTKGSKILATDTYIPTQYDLTTYEGFKLLERNHPTIAMGFNRYNNSRGQQSGRLIEGRAEYNRQILGWSDAKVRSVNNNGGLRIFSFSDFEVVHLLDLVQVIIDCAAKGVKIQGYTKIPAFARLVRATGIKLNRSFIPKGETGIKVVNGKRVLDIDTVEGIDINDENFLDESDNPDVGNVIIGINPEQIGIAFTDPMIDYIIPFHSNKAKAILKKLGLETWVNYKESQHEKDISTGKASKHNVNIYTQVINKYHPTNKVEFVNAFLKECKAQGKIPRYSEFLNIDENGDFAYREGYHKLLVDFKMFDKDGNILPQGEITPNLDNEFMAKLLADEVDKKANYEFPQEVYEEIDEAFGDTMKHSDRDSEGNQLSKEQQEFFKDSKVRDKDGRLLVCTHNSPSKFTVFDKNMIGDGNGLNFGAGFYFFARSGGSIAKHYGDNQYKSYLNLKNPYDYYSMSKEYIVGMLEKSGYDYDKEFVDSYDYEDLLYADLIDDLLDEALKGKDPYTEFSKMLQNAGFDGIWADEEIVAFEPNQIKSVTNEKPTSDPDIRYSDRDLAPTFYSQMGKVVDGMKQDKFGADSIIPMLRGRGVKAEEIRWSGIATWLEGKKSVTKAELMEFIQGSMLQIGEQMSGQPTTIKGKGYRRSFGSNYHLFTRKIGGDYRYVLYDNNNEVVDEFYLDDDEVVYVSEVYGETYEDDDALFNALENEYGDASSTRWSRYKLDGGENYREIVFTMPNSSYTNRAMQAHWGQDAEGVLAHARIQDFDVNGKKMLFIEEIQSDWHNEGHSKGYSTKEYEDAVESHDKLYNEYKKMDLALHKYIRSNEFMTDPEDVRKKKHDWLRGKAETAQKKYLDAEKVVNSLKEKGAGDTPDAPFKDTYHEYVLKRLLRMAAEQGYDSIGWTPAWVQEMRWSEDYAEGYRIEYDQDMPKFLKKYGRQWGAKVDKTYIKTNNHKEELVAERIAESQKQLAFYEEDIKQYAPDSEDAEFDRVAIENLKQLLEELKGTKVWSMDITDSMKDSVLHEGQMMYSLREVDPVQPTSDKWKRTQTTAEVKAKFPSLWDVSADESEVRNPTQISGTVKSYRKVYDFLKAEGFNGTILDASSGLGYGTRAGIEEYGFKVDDIEPYPDKSYKPKYKDYSRLHKKYDVIISNAVLNVIPQDQRDALVVKMGELLKDGGRMFINVRGDDVKNASSKVAINEDLMEYYISQSGSYQKGFTKSELVAYLQDALGEGFTVKPISWFGKTSAIVTKAEYDGSQLTARDRFFIEALRSLDNKTDASVSQDVPAEEENATGVNRARILHQRILEGLSEEFRKKAPSFDEWLSDKKDERGYYRTDTKLMYAIHNNFKGSGRAKADALYELVYELMDLRRELNSNVKFSERDSDSVSNRSLLANALESAVQNDIERNKLAQYKEKIELIEKEEAKLHKLRGQLKEALFSKGRRDSEKINKLRFEENQTASRINTYDRQLLTLEASKPLKAVLEREKKLAYEKAEKEGVKALMAYREKASKTTRELMTRYQESRAKATEGRHKTAYRHKIKKVVGDLNQLLLRPTKDKHIQEGLKIAVAEALSVINMDTVGAEERIAKLNDLIAKANDPNVIAELTATRDRIELQGENLKDKLSALQTAYEKIKNSTDPELKNAYQEPVMNAIKNVVDQVGNTSIRDMSLTQLEAVYEMYKMILHTVRTANKAFKAKKGETITQLSETVNDEIRKVGKEKFTRSRIGAGLRKSGWTLLKPLTAFRTIGSDTFTGLYNELRNGEDVFYTDINEAKSFIQEKYKKYNFKSWDQKKTKTFTAKSGKTFTLNLEQMMSIYAYSRRTQAHDHIIEGGIVLEDAVIEEKKFGLPFKYKVDTKSAFNISEETLTEICDSLTAEQKTFVEVMQEYLSDVMGAKGNEVSMELLGVELFKEKFYFPLKSSKYYMGFKPEEAGEIKLKNPAFSKETVQHANNPVVLKNFTDVWATHINDMSMYHAFVLPLEDFTRVYNYKTKTDALLETMSTEATIANAFGEGATQYIRNFLKSLNGGVRVDGVGIADKAISLTKKGAVLASASVTIQQPSAIMRAMALVNPIHFVATTHKSINLFKHKTDWAELKTYAPIAGIKEMGGYDIGMGQGTVAWIKDQSTIQEKVDDALGKAPAFMDEITWVSIWNAVKRETASKNKGMDVKSEEFLKKAGERFTEVISMTQVYDSVFSRSDIMRNANPLAKMLTAFMAEPSTTLNMLVDSVIQGKRTGKVGGFVKATGTTAGAVVAAIVFNSALKSIITAMRDDDEDESYAEKYIGAFVGNAMDDINPLGYIPFVKDVVSIFKGYDVERMDMALFSDLKQAIDAFDSDSKSEYEKWSGLVGAVSAFFGVPIKNVERDIRGAYNTIKSFSEGERTTSAGIKASIREAVTGEKDSNSQQLYEAIVSGDQAQIDRVKGRFEDQDAIDTAIKNALRENDSRIKEAAQARIDGDIAGYTRIAREIIAEGYFKQDYVVGAINAEINAIKREQEQGTTENSSEVEEDEVTSIYKTSDLNTAFDNGDTAMAKEIIQDLIDTKIANGMDEKSAKASLRSSMTSYWKPLYKEAYSNNDSAEMYRIRLILLDSGLYGTSNDVVKTVQNWLKD